MQTNTLAVLPQEETLIREMRENLRGSRPGTTLSLRMESAEATPCFVAVLGQSCGFGETAAAALGQCAQKASDQVADLKEKADALGLMLVAKPETAAKELE